MYKIIDHTADVGIEVEGHSLAELFESAGEAVFDLMFFKKREYIPTIETRIELKADDIEGLFVHWLQELLYIYDTRHLVLSKFWIDDIDEIHLSGAAKGLKFDSTRHEQKLSIKAVTYHRLEVKKEASDIWRARVIFDI